MSSLPELVALSKTNPTLFSKYNKCEDVKLIKKIQETNDQVALTFLLDRYPQTIRMVARDLKKYMPFEDACSILQSFALSQIVIFDYVNYSNFSQFLKVRLRQERTRIIDFETTDKRKPINQIYLSKEDREKIKNKKIFPLSLDIKVKKGSKNINYSGLFTFESKTPEQNYLSSKRLEILRALADYAKLKGQERIVYLAHLNNSKGKELNHKFIADQLDLEESNVKATFHEAIKKIRVYVKRKNLQYKFLEIKTQKFDSFLFLEKLALNNFQY